MCRDANFVLTCAKLASREPSYLGNPQPGTVAAVYSGHTRRVFSHDDITMTKKDREEFDAMKKRIDELEAKVRSLEARQPVIVIPQATPEQPQRQPYPWESPIKPLWEWRPWDQYQSQPYAVSGNSVKA